MQKLNILPSLRQVFFTIKNSIKQLLLFVFLYQLVISLGVRPFISFVFSLFIKLKGYPVLINADMAIFFNSLTGIIVGFILLAMVAIAIYFEFSTLLNILNHSKPNGKHSIVSSLESSMYSLKMLKDKGIIFFILYSIVLIPLFGFGLQPAVLPHLKIPNFVVNEIEKFSGGIILLILFTILGTFLFIRLVLVFPLMVFEKQKFLTAAKNSFTLTKSNSIRIFLLTSIVLVLSTAIAGIPAMIFMQVRGVLFLPFKAGSFLLSVVASAIFPSSMICVTFVCYKTFYPQTHSQDDEKQEHSKFYKFLSKISDFATYYLNKAKTFFSKKMPNWLANRSYLVVIFLTIPVVLFIDFVIPLGFEPPSVVVIGHRGSLDGVENTTEAILGAYEQGADYAEIDILLSKDGIPMVIHDNNLSRLAGKKAHVSDLTADQLSEYTLSDRGYTGKISTLDEICEIAKDKIDLLIEIKTHGKETESVVEQTFRVIMKHNMQKQVMYQSTSKEILNEINIKFPEAKVGYIVFGYIGNLSKSKIMSLNADFLGVEESFVTSTLVNSCHKAGKSVFVWTINQYELAASLYNLEIDGIITDYPDVIISQIEEINNKN